MHPSVAAIYICLFAAMTHIQWQLLPLTLEMRLRHISKPLSPCTRMTSRSAWVTSQAIIPTIYHLAWSHGGQCLLLQWESNDWSSRNYHLGKRNGLFTEKVLLDVGFFGFFFFTLVINLYQLHFALLSSSSAIDAFKVCNLVKLSEVLVIAQCGWVSKLNDNSLEK